MSETDTIVSVWLYPPGSLRMRVSLISHNRRIWKVRGKGRVRATLSAILGSLRGEIVVSPYRYRPAQLDNFGISK